MLVDSDPGFDFRKLALSDDEGAPSQFIPGPLQPILGVPKEPGRFRIAQFMVALRQRGKVFPCLPLPADLVVSKPIHGQYGASYLQPVDLPRGLACSYPLEQIPLLRRATLGKPDGKWWLNTQGIGAYLHGQPIHPHHLVDRDALWVLDTRTGIGMDPSTRTAQIGMIYTSEVVASRFNSAEDTSAGFFVSVSGADETTVPKDGLLRLGGDGRAAVIYACQWDVPQPSWDEIHKTGRFRLIMVTPGIFPAGWRGAMKKGAGSWWQGYGWRARLVGASVSRHEIISGWNLVDQCPKPAKRVVPSGSVYWFQDLQGDPTGVPENGVWPEKGSLKGEEKNRWAEGFNSALIGTWPEREMPEI